MKIRTYPTLMAASLGLALVVLNGCGPRARAQYRPPDIRRVTGVGVMNVQPPSQPAPTYQPQQPAPRQISLAGTVRAEGVGVPRPGTSPAQAKALARRAAVTDARRNLLEEVKGVRVNSETLVRDFMTEYDVIQTEVSGYVQGAQVVEEYQEADGTYVVVMEADMSGIGDIIRRYAPPPQPRYVEPRPSAAPTGGPNVAQARAMARRAAELDAQRKLLEMAKGLRLESGSTVENFMLQSDVIASRVQGIIRGAETTDVRYNPDGSVEVDMQLDFNQIRYNVR